MWNKRKEDEYPPKGAPAPASTPAVQKETHAAVTTAGISSHGPARPMAVIGKSVTIKGQIISREDLTVDGELEGSIELQEHRLTIGPNGKLHAGVRAREIVVLGTVNGNVEASDKIEIRKDAKLVGDIKTMRIVIEDGAYFKGSIDITKPEGKPAAAAAPKPAAAPAAPAPAAQPAPAVPAPAAAPSAAQPAPAATAASSGSSGGKPPLPRAAENKR